MGRGVKVSPPIPSGGFQDAPAFDAVRANLDLAPTSCVGVDDGVDDVQIGLEQAWRDRGDVLADAALFLGLAAPQNPVPAHVTFAANFTTSRHFLTPFGLRAANNSQTAPTAQGKKIDL